LKPRRKPWSNFSGKTMCNIGSTLGQRSPLYRSLL
jgi:hypothetical protein